MNERQRMEYLEGMGIDMFVPRYHLVGARMSAQASLPIAESTENLSSQGQVEGGQSDRAGADMEVPVEQDFVAGEASVVKADSSIAMRSVGNIMEQIQGNRSSDAGAEKTTVPATQITEESREHSSSQETVHFSLSIWRVTDRLVIIDSRPINEPLPTQALLENILAAKQLKMDSARPELLNWPMFSGAPYQGGWQAASEMVRAFLQARLDQKTAKYVWVMGKEAFAAVCKGDQNFDSAKGFIRAEEELSLSLVILPSLASMLKDPSLKRLTWETIKDLN